jgi:uncharacterized protein
MLESQEATNLQRVITSSSKVTTFIYITNTYPKQHQETNSDSRTMSRSYYQTILYIPHREHYTETSRIVSTGFATKQAAYRSYLRTPNQR